MLSQRGALDMIMNAFDTALDTSLDAAALDTGALDTGDGSFGVGHFESCDFIGAFGRYLE